MDSSENVARILKAIWISGGEIAPAAFTLRPNVHETYISVLREKMPTFENDALSVAHRKRVKYASINVGELTSRKDNIVSENITYSVKPTDNEKLRSHAGIYIAVNGHNIVGGEPFQHLIQQKGVAEDIVLLCITEQLAYIAQKNIKSIERNERNIP